MAELFIWIRHHRKQRQTLSYSIAPYDKSVGDMNFKATYRMKWASLSPPLAVSTA